MSKKSNSLGKAIAVGSAIAGAAIGATAVILSDKKNQEKIKKTFGKISKDAVKIGKDMKKKAEDFSDDLKKNEKETEKTVKEAVEKEESK